MNLKLKNRLVNEKSWAELFTEIISSSYTFDREWYIVDIYNNLILKRSINY